MKLLRTKLMILLAASLWQLGCATPASHHARGKPTSQGSSSKASTATVTAAPPLPEVPTTDVLFPNVAPTPSTGTQLVSARQDSGIVHFAQATNLNSSVATTTQLPAEVLDSTMQQNAEETRTVPVSQALTLHSATGPVSQFDLSTWMGEYQIEIGDSLDIKFRNTPELDNQVTVRPDGMISLEIVGDVPAAGSTPNALRQLLREAYRQELKEPEIAVIVRSFSGNSIYIGGEVYAPGRVPLTGRVTTLKAIITAGGFRDTADQRRVVVRRADGTCCECDIKAVIECTGEGQDLQLQPYDVVYVPKSRIAKVNLWVEQYIDKVLPFSRSFGIFVSHNTGLPAAVGP